MIKTYSAAKHLKCFALALTALVFVSKTEAQSTFVICDSVIDQVISSNNTVCVPSNFEVFSVPSQANMHYEWTFPANVTAFTYSKSEIPAATSVPPLGTGLTPQSLFQVTSNMKFQIAYSAAELANTFGWKANDVIDSLIFKFKSTTGGPVTFKNYRIVYYKLSSAKTWSNPLTAGVDVAVNASTPGVIGTPVYVFGNASSGDSITMNVPNTGTGVFALKLKTNTLVWDGTSNIVLSFEYWNTNTIGMGSYVMYNETSSTYNVLALKCNTGSTNANSVNSGFQISGYNKSLVTPFTNAGIIATGSPVNYGASTQRPRITFSKKNTSTTDKNVINSNWTNTAISGSVCVKIYNNCDSSKICKNIIVPSTKPTNPGAVSGPALVCDGSSRVYGINKVTGADSYEWTPPQGSSINGSSAAFVTIDTSVAVLFKPGYAGDTLRVRAINCKGISGFRKLAIGFDSAVPAMPGTISGQANGLCFKNNITYKINSVANATSYTWRTDISGATVNGQSVPVTTPDTAVTISFAKLTTGNIYVKANRCLSGAERVKAVFGKPAVISAISGPTTVCKNQLSVSYKATPVFGATSYSWILPTGATYQYGAGTDSIVIGFGTPTGSKLLKVAGVNSCDTGAYFTLNLNIMVCPRMAGQSTIEDDINLYPNPANDQFVFEYSATSPQPYSLTITDMPGRKCMEITGQSNAGMNQQTIDIRDLKPGIYFVTYESGDIKRVTKFSKK